jgi:hypothetical protein
MRQPITRINVLDMAAILLLFEGATLFVMGALPFVLPLAFRTPGVGGIASDIILGLLVGVFGTLIALGIWHVTKRVVRGTLGGKEFTITHINLIPAAIGNAVFLTVLFLIEDTIARISSVPFLGTALLGFAATALSFLILFAIYNLLPLKLGMTLNGKHVRVKRIAPLQTALLAGLYEAFILPSMAFLFGALHLNPVLAYTLNGVISGIIGGVIGTLLTNWLAPYLKPWIELI